MRDLSETDNSLDEGIMGIELDIGESSPAKDDMDKKGEQYLSVPVGGGRYAMTYATAEPSSQIKAMKESRRERVPRKM